MISENGKKEKSHKIRCIFQIIHAQTKLLAFFLLLSNNEMKQTPHILCLFQFNFIFRRVFGCDSCFHSSLFFFWCRCLFCDMIFNLVFVWHHSEIFIAFESGIGLQWKEIMVNGFNDPPYGYTMYHSKHTKKKELSDIRFSLSKASTQIQRDVLLQNISIEHWGFVYVFLLLLLFLTYLNNCATFFNPKDAKTKNKLR